MSNNYISQDFDINNPEFVSVIDDLPLWSAPFGIKLLDMVILKPNIKALDIGCGAGFPLIELAQRLGSTSEVYGIDIWDKALERAKLKSKVWNISNVKLIQGAAENLPFDDNYFDLIISNNGINNVEDIEKVLSECHRTSKNDARLLFSMNLEETMIEFYNVFKEILSKNNLKDEADKVSKHIYEKRKPVNIIESYLKNSGYNIFRIEYDNFYLRYLNGTVMLNHFLIRVGFLKSWKEILKPEVADNIFGQIESKLNIIAKKKGEIKLSVPFAVFDCKKR